jgi:hypothetical protein
VDLEHYLRASPHFPAFSVSLNDSTAMDFNEAQSTIVRLFTDANAHFHKVPGSAIILRYIKSSYQNDPVRSAIELFLFLFAVRYLLAPTYSTEKNKQVSLSEEEIDELVEDWTPEPLVAPPTQFEELENEKRPVIVGYVTAHQDHAGEYLLRRFAGQLDRSRSSPTAEPS